MSIQVGFQPGSTRTRNRIAQFGSDPAATINMPPQGGVGGPRPIGATIMGSVASMLAAAQAPIWLQNMFHGISKEGPNAILPTEIATAGGRSAVEYKRSGILGLNERLTEEILVAVIWLWGVQGLRKFFDKMLKPALFKNSEHISSDTAWNKMGKKLRDVDLNAQEKYGKNSAEVSKLLKIKTMRWAFSVGTAMALAAYIIPKLNQWKTNWVLKNQKNQAASPPSPPAAPSLTTTANFTPSFPTGPAINPPLTNTPLPQAAGGLAAPLSALSPQIPANPKFGMFSPASLMQGLGHMVEQTSYGSILVIDAGITGGRAMVAKLRSIYESLEIIVRDVASLYFYIMAVPHTMWLLSRLIDPIFKTSMQIQPKASQQINEYLQKHLRQKGLQGKGVSLDTLREILMGASDERLTYPSEYLKRELSRVSVGNAFAPLLEKEIAAYLNLDPEKTKSLANDVADALGKKEIHPGDIKQLLENISNGRNGFKALNPEERKNLGMAVKQAFRHTVGMHFPMNAQSALELLKPFEGTLAQLPAEQRLALTERILRMGKLDSLDQANSMLRRSINLSREAFSPDDVEKLGIPDDLRKAWTAMAAKEKLDFKTVASRELFKLRHETMADWVDRAVNQKLGLEEFLQDELQGIRDSLEKRSFTQKLSGKTPLLNQLDTGLQEALKTNTLTVADLGCLEKSLLKLGETRQDARKLLETVRRFNILVAPSLAENGNGKLTAEMMGTLAKRSIGQAMRDLPGYLNGNTPQAVKDLLGHYQVQIDSLISGQRGRLFHLFLSDQDELLQQKMDELLKGGLKNDGSFLRKVLQELGQFDPDTKRYNSPEKATKQQKAVNHYLDRLMQKLESAATQSENGIRTVLNPENILSRFQNLNRNLHYLSKGFALSGAMLCIGFAVPAAMNLLTYKLTGKNYNPGIASAETAHNGNVHPPQTPAAMANIPYTPLKRNNFQAFKT